MDKQISIVIATYNASKTLKRCLDSIVPQLTAECELIVIDGQSTDGTPDIIAQYGSAVAYTVSEPDKGIYDAWNKGIRAARGQWVMFVGADDVLLPGALGSYLEALHATPGIGTYDYVCAQNEYVDKQGRLLKVLGGYPGWNVMRRTMVAAHVASLHSKRNLFDATGGYDLRFRICADYELLMRKRDRLKPLFLPRRMARMEVGGMSFSTKAIVETFRIRELHRSVPRLCNLLLLARDWLAFKFFILRKTLAGKSL